MLLRFKLWRWLFNGLILENSNEFYYIWCLMITSCFLIKSTCIDFNSIFNLLFSWFTTCNSCWIFLYYSVVVFWSFSEFISFCFRPCIWLSLDKSLLSSNSPSMVNPLIFLSLSKSYFFKLIWIFSISWFFLLRAFERVLLASLNSLLST